MLRYRIYTEDKGIPKLRLELERIVSKRFDGYTIFDGATGYWKSARENTIVFEIIAESEYSGWIDKVAKQIKKANGQESVLWTAEQVETNFV